MQKYAPHQLAAACFLYSDMLSEQPWRAQTVLSIGLVLMVCFCCPDCIMKVVLRNIEEKFMRVSIWFPLVFPYTISVVLFQLKLGFLTQFAWHSFNWAFASFHIFRRIFSMGLPFPSTVVFFQSGFGFLTQFPSCSFSRALVPFHNLCRILSIGISLGFCFLPQFASYSFNWAFGRMVTSVCASARVL